MQAKRDIIEEGKSKKQSGMIIFVKEFKNDGDQFRDKKAEINIETAR